MPTVELQVRQATLVDADEDLITNKQKQTNPFIGPQNSSGIK